MLRISLIFIGLLFSTLIIATPMLKADFIFESQSEFVAAAGSLDIETFESSPNIGTEDSGGLLEIIFDDFTASADIEALKIFDTPLFGNGNTTPGGENYLAVDTDIGFTSTDLTLSFDSPIDSLGFFLVDAEEPYTVSIDGSEFSIGGFGDGSVSYFGIIADSPFGSITIASTGTDSFSSIDDVSYGNSIPEPSSCLIICIVAAAFLKRKQTAAN